MRVELSRLTEGSLHQINVQWTVVNLPWHAFFGGSSVWITSEGPVVEVNWAQYGQSNLIP